MKFIDDLKKRFEEKLPAELAHNLLMNYKRKTAGEVQAEKKDVRISAVLCLLFHEEGEWKTYLMVRNAYKGVHSAQVSFPGGKKEDFDSDLIRTALRESEEELNISPDSVEIIGELSTLYIPPSNFLVYPYVGVSYAEQNIIPDSREVAEVIKVSMNSFTHPESIKRGSIKSSEGMSMKVNHYEVDGHIVWGATAMMLAELAYMINEIE